MTKNRLSAILLLMLGGAIFLLSKKFPQLDEGYPGPGLFPSILGIVIGLAGIAIFFQTDDPEEQRSEKASASVPSLLVLVATMAAIPMLVDYVGLLPLVALVIICVGILAKVKPSKVVLTSLVTTGLVFVIFSLILGVSI